MIESFALYKQSVPNFTPLKLDARGKFFKKAKLKLFSLLLSLFIKIFIIFILYSSVNNFFYLDIQNKCFIRIAPSWTEFSNSTIKKALSIMKTVSYQNYMNTCKRVRVIDPNTSCGGAGGGCFSKLDSKTIDVSSYQDDIIFANVVIVHETCHIQQRDEKRGFSEDECYKTGYRVLKDLLSY